MCVLFFLSKVIGLAVFFAMLLKPVAVEETEEVEQVLQCKIYIFRNLVFRSYFSLL